MTAAIEQLQQLGFSQYEAQAYITLLKSNPLNGYELAKASGIPRPNIYPVLHKLEERGAVLRIDSPDGARYSPVHPEELLSKLNQQVQKTLQTASCALQEITQPPALEHILNLRSYKVLLDNARALLNSAQEHLVLGIWPEEAVALADPLQQAAERGVEITTLCLRGCAHACPACRGSVFRYPIAPSHSGRWLILVSDNNELLAGEISARAEALAVRSRQIMLVNLTGSYIQNGIALASILTCLGDRLGTVLDPQTIAAINTLHPLHSQGPWLDMMQRMIRPIQDGTRD
jgi:predicted transcriptional regulator